MPPHPLGRAAIDTRALKPGGLFFALRGEKSDGHDHLPAAAAAGAGAAVVRRGTRAEGPPLLEVDDPQTALTACAVGWRSLLTDAQVVAVTGSSGKTTVKEMTADLLATAGAVARSPGNWNNHLGVPLSVLAMEATDRFGVFEVGMNHPGELDPLCALLRPHTGVVTSVGPVHLEFFSGVAAIAEEKAAVVRAVGTEGLAVLPADDPWYPALRAYARGRVAAVSQDDEADYRVERLGGLAFRVQERATGTFCDFEAPLPGRYIVHDALLAIAVARGAGLPWDLLPAALAAFRPVGLRWQRETCRGVLLVNDAYNANPMSMRAALEAFAETPTEGRRWLVLGGMRELGASAEAEHRALGRAVAAGAAAGRWAGLLAVGEEGRWIAESAREAGLAAEGAMWCVDADAGAAALALRARAGDAVLFKASRGVKLEHVAERWKSQTQGPGG